MRRILALSVASALVGACDRNGDKAPGGQVVATVDGQEITAAELQLEIGGAAIDPNAGADARKAVVRALIARKLLVAEAKARQLDTSVAGGLARERARDLALVDLLRADVARPARMLSGPELDRYIASRAEAFSRRALITADQIILGGNDPELIRQLKGMPSLAAVEAFAARNTIPSVRSVVVVDTLYASPQTAAALAAAAAGTLVVEPNAGRATRVLQILERRSAPVSGNEARSAARSLMMRDADARTRAALDKIIATGQARVTRQPADLGTR